MNVPLNAPCAWCKASIDPNEFWERELNRFLCTRCGERRARIPKPPYGQFIGKPPPVDHLTGKLGRIEREVVYVDKRGFVWRCPAGWVCDGASVPWFMWRVFNPWDQRWLRSACIHDARFSVHDRSFNEANDLFAECLQADATGNPVKLFRWAVGTSIGAYSYYHIPNQPANQEKIAAMQKQYFEHGPEIWTPDTLPKPEAA